MGIKYVCFSAQMYRWRGRHLSSDGVCAFVMKRSGLVLACALQSVMFKKKKKTSFIRNLEEIFLKMLTLIVWKHCFEHTVTMLFFISIIGFCFTATNAVLYNQTMFVRQPQNILQDASLSLSSQPRLVELHLKREPKAHSLPYSFCCFAV